MAFESMSEILSRKRRITLSLIIYEDDDTNAIWERFTNEMKTIYKGVRFSTSKKWRIADLAQYLIYLENCVMNG